MIIEQVTGKSYEAALKEQILTRLGMGDTGYDHADEILSKRASGYRKTLDGLENAPYLDMSIPFSAGALYSTVEDLYRWDQALYTDRVLSAKSRELLFRPNVKMDARPGSTETYQYAYGWVIGAWTIAGSGKTLRTVGHGGGINGFNTDIVRLVDDRHLIVMLCNENGLDWQGAEKGIAAILYGQQPEYPKRPIAGVFSQTLKTRGMEAAIRQFRDLKARGADRYDFAEPVMNQLGYQLLDAKRIREAIEVFKLNLESYPKSANAYDSLGEAFRRAGDNEAAIRNYRKALELDPSHDSAAKALRELQKK